MIIKKIMNNNVVFAIDDAKNEVVLVGKGLGFGKKRGQIVDKEKVEKVFRMQNDSDRNKIADLLTRISPEDFRIADTIIKYAQSVLGKRLAENIYITLTDHIVFAMDRVKQGLSFKNQMLWEIKHYYPEEFAIGKYALEFIKDKTGIEMPEDEAGFIAFHIANADIEQERPMVETTSKIIDNALRIVEYHYHKKLDEDSLDYGRFVIHMKFCISRAFSNKMLDEGDKMFTELIKKQYEEAFICAERIAKYIKKEFGLELTDDELVYLTVHIKRITDPK